jgi:ABC-type transport system involved in multi-copper enzyme maturation permease subunit
MIRAIFWKEWHEHRSKYLGYWITIHAPILLLVLAIGLSSTSRTPFAGLSDAMTLKWLPMALLEPAMVITIFLLLTGYLAVATFSPEIEDRSLFFIYEQPVSRKRYLAMKLLNGGAHVVLATSCATLLMPLAAYWMMLISGKVTSAGSASAFAAVMAAAGRAAVWGALISLAAFLGSAIVSALIPKWWLAALCSVVLTTAYLAWGLNAYSLLPDMPNDTMSIGLGFSTGNAQWVTVSRAFKLDEINAIAQFWRGPLLITVLAIAAFCAALTVLYDHKELKG